MSEHSLWTTTRKALAPYGLLARIENRVGDGTPDVLYCLQGHTGLMELKHLPSWPKRQATPVHIAHLTLEQVLWLESWRDAGGAAWLLLQAGREYLLLTPEAARMIYERRLTPEALRHARWCAVRAVGRFPVREVVRVLSSQQCYPKSGLN